MKKQFSDFIDSAERLIENSQSRRDINITDRNLIDAIAYEKNLSLFLEDLQYNKDNWLVTNIIKSDRDNKITKIKIEPLDVSNYFKDIFDKGIISLLMSATILSKDNLCNSIGLKNDKVKFIKVEESEFSIKHRPIYLMNVAG